MIKVILWDIDGTLLSFKEAERAAMRAGFAAFGLGELTDEMLKEYSAINASYWKRLELGELTKPQVLRGRFEEFFRKRGLDTACVDEFNAQYQVRLGQTVVFNDNGKELVESLRGRVKQYAVTNGTLVAQKGKLKNSGLDRLLDDVFISDVVGVEKPGIGFFDAVFAAIGRYEPDEVLIVGDSLTSDIKGGNNAGILCGWYNPEGQPVPEGLRVDYDIRDLNQVGDILAASRPESALERALLERGLTLGVAESITGGLMAKRLTDVPGASRVFRGGVVSYTNEVKRDVLGVPEQLLEEYGAVSAPVAEAMAEGARRLLGCDIALSATGVAGPDRDDRGNPVGTVFVGIATPEGSQVCLLEPAGEATREQLREQTADRAFALALEYLKGNKG